MKLEINSAEVHPELSHYRHPVDDGAPLGADSLWSIGRSVDSFFHQHQHHHSSFMQMETKINSRAWKIALHSLVLLDQLDIFQIPIAERT